MKFYKRLEELGYETYQDYLNSDHWKSFRGKMEKKLKYKCLCGQKDGLCLHHKTYKRLGSEHKCNVVWLCRDCHEETHVLVKSGESTLWKGTNALQKTDAFQKRKIYWHKIRKEMISPLLKTGGRKKKKRKIRMNVDRFTRQELMTIFYAVDGVQNPIHLGNRDRIRNKLRMKLTEEEINSLFS